MDGASGLPITDYNLSENAMALQKIRKALFIGSAWTAFISLGAYAYLEYSYVYYPRIPNPELGRVVPHNVKGITVYITANQSEAIHAIVWILGVSGALILINLFLNQKWPIGKEKH